MTPRATASTPGVGSTITSEFIKLTTIRSQRALIAVAIGLAPLVAVALFLSLPVTQGTTLGELPPNEILSAAILGVDAAAFVVILLAAIHVGSEYSTGMIQPTLTITSTRWRVLVAKFATVGALALVVGALTSALCVAVSVIAASAVGVEASAVLTAAGIQLALGAMSMPVIYGVIAAAGAFLFRSIALGIVLPIGVMIVGGLAGWFGEGISGILTPLMPVAAIHSLSGVATGPESIGVVGATISLLAWVGVSMGAAAWRFLRSDA